MKQHRNQAFLHLHTVKQKQKAIFHGTYKIEKIFTLGPGPSRLCKTLNDICSLDIYLRFSRLTNNDMFVFQKIIRLCAYCDKAFQSIKVPFR